MIHVLDFDGNIVDYFSRKDNSIIEAKHLINVQDDVETFDFTVISDRGEFVRERNRIVVEVSPDTFREFIIIKTVDEMDGYTEVNCVGSHLEDISKSKPIKPTTLKNLTLDQIMYEILRGTGWQVGDIAFLGDKTYTINEHVSPFEILKEVKKLFGHEYEFEVKIDGNKIVERKVNCVIPNSIFNGREIVYGKDLLGMTRTVDTENVVTAYLVVGPEYAPNKRLVAEVTDKQAQDKFGVKGDFLWGILEVDDEEARRGVPATTTTTTTKKPVATTTTTKKLYTRATTKVVGTKTHTVRKGDTLYTIAQKYGVTQQSIKDANKLRSSTIKVGQRLKIIITAKVTTTTTRSTTKKPVTTTTTTVMQKVEQDGIIANLKKIGQREINKVNQASLSYEITSLDIRKQYPHEIINIGDKVRIKNRDFKPPLYADARVIEIETDIIANEQTYKFGSIKEYAENSLRAYFNLMQSRFEKKLEDNIKNLDTIIESKIDNTEVFERAITKSENPPENPVNGTLWYDISNPDLAVIREYRDGEWVGATAEDISQIGGMTVEQIAFGQLMQLYAVVVGEMNGLENSYNEILESEYMDREDIKEELKTAYNSMQEIFLSVTSLTTSIEEETVTMDELDTLNNDMIEYKYSVTDFYVIIEKAKKYIQEKIKILQSQYTEEKFNDAMDKVAKAIDGTYDKETGNLIANVPNQDQINQLIKELKEYSDGNDNTLKSSIETTITNKITDSETEFGRQFTEIEKKIDGIEIGGRNLIENTSSMNKDINKTWSSYNQLHMVDIASANNKLKVGDTVTLSFDVQMTVGTYLRIYDSNGQIDKTLGDKTYTNIGNTKQRLSYTTTLKTSTKNNTAWWLAFYNNNNGDKFIIENIKLEKGNIATDYTPAPEDIKNDLDKSNKSLNEYKSYIETTFKEGILTDAEYIRLKSLSDDIDKDNLDLLTNITDLSNNSKLAVTLRNELLALQTKYKQSYKTLKDNMVTVISDKKITLEENTLISNNISTYNQSLSDINTHIQKCLNDIANNLAKDRSNEAINNLQIGGRNLVLKSNNGASSSVYLVNRYELSEDWTTDEYTITIWGTVNSDIQKFGAWVDNASVSLGYLTPNATRDVWTGTFNGKISQAASLYPKRTLSIYNFPQATAGASSITRIKLEKGNKSSDWTPAPEDIESSFSNVSVSINKLNGEVNATKEKFNTVYTKEETITKVNESLEPVTNLVNNNKSDIAQLNDSLKLYVKATDYATDKDNIVQRLNTTESGMDILSNKIGLAVTRDDYQKGIEETKKYADDIVDNIVVGGRNLLKDSLSRNKGFEDNSNSNYKYLWKIYIDELLDKVKVGDEITISFDLQMERGDILRIYDNVVDPGMSIGSDTITNVGNKKFRYKYTTKIIKTSGTNSRWAIYVYNDNNGDKFSIENVKIEKGNVATDWTPAPEDIESSVNDLQVGLNDYKDYISKSFKDTVITESEAKAIEQQKVFLESQKITLDNQYISLYNNSILDNTEEKKALLSAKTNYETSYVKLIEAINSVIADGRANAQETAGVLSKFDVYKDNLGKLAKQLEDTNDAITTGKVKRINVGTRNLIDSMSLNLSGKGVTGDTEELIMGEWAYKILDNSWVKKKLKSNTTYSISYTVELVSKPTTKSSTTVFGRTYLYSPTNTNSRVIMGELPSGYYDTMNVGDMYSVKSTFTTPTLSDDTYVIFYNAIHGVSPYDKSVAKFHNVILSEGNTIGDYQRAPEDLDERLKTMKANIDVLENNINLKVSEENFNKTKETLSKAVSLIDILSNNVTISTEQDGSKSIGSFNPDSIKLDSKMIDLNNGDVTIQNGVTTIKEAYIPKLFSNQASIEYLKARDIDLNRATVSGATEGETTVLSGGKIRSTGTFTRTFPEGSAIYESYTESWNGTYRSGLISKTSNNKKQTGITRWLSLNDKAVTTQREIHSASPDKNGARFIDFFAEETYGSDVTGQGMHIYSGQALKIESEYGLYLNANKRFYIRTEDSGLEINRDGQNLVLKRTSPYNSIAGTGGSYMSIQSSDGVEQGHVGILSNNRHLSLKSSYGEVLLKGSKVFALDSDGVNRVQMYAQYFSGEKIIGNIEAADTNIYAMCHDELRVVSKAGYNGGDITYKNLRFGSWNAMSHEKFKHDIKEWDYNVLDIYRNDLQLHSYKVNSEADSLYYRIHHGIVIRENSNLDRFPIEWRNGDGFDGNEVLWWNTKAIQELALENETLKNDNETLKKDSAILNSRVSSLEDRLKMLEEKLNG